MGEGNGETAMICEMDGAEMIPMEAGFSYLGRDFRHTVLRCPVCGQVYIPEDTAAGRMREVEKSLEDK
ncbi:MAG: hypothetical protein LBG82_02245 [Clostridiales Family XIII bacterium]|jgi:hypothetical protein|nr:hypothetical protein [Clostridiales Family XIII bacterium]